MTPKSSIGRAVLATALSALLIGCGSTAILTKPLQRSSSPDPNTVAVEGIPYFLPKGDIQVSLESIKDTGGKHQELSVSTKAELLPDPSAGFVLESFVSGETSKDHQFKLTNGMLSLVTTEDDSKVDEIISDLASIAANVFSFGSLGGFDAASAQPRMSFTDTNESQQITYDPIPTSAERAEALNLIRKGVHTFSSATLSDETAPLPGTDGLLLLKVEHDEGEQLKDSVKPSAASEHRQYKGIYTRTLTPDVVTLTVQLDLVKHVVRRRKKQLTTLRTAGKTLSGLPAEIRKLQVRKAGLEEAKRRDESEVATRRNNLKGFEVEITKYQPGTPDYQKYSVLIRHEITWLDEAEARLKETTTNLKSTSAALSKAEKDLATLPDRIKELEHQISQAAKWIKDPSARLFSLDQHKAVVMAPDESVIVKIPVDRAELGTTKNRLVLHSGILAEYQTERPSTTLELVKIPLKISQSLVSLPTNILQLKIDYATKQHDLLEKQNEIADSQAKDPEKDALEREKELKKLEAEIAKYEYQIKNPDGK